MPNPLRLDGRRCIPQMFTRSQGVSCPCRTTKSSTIWRGGPTTSSPTPKAGPCGPQRRRRHSAPQPRAIAALPAVNQYLRHGAGLGGRVRELAILTTARELNSQFEWAAHEPPALEEGISTEIIDLVRRRSSTSVLDEARRDRHRTGPRDFGARKVASETFGRALQQFGRRALVNLVALMGNYAGTAALLTAFDMQLDPDQPLPLAQF
jgi:4-carboxymuconolactone decarboxylase